MKAGTHSPFGEESHTTAHTPKQGPSLSRPQCGLCCQRNFFYSATLLYTYISRFFVNPQHQQIRKIWQSCCHKFYPKTAFHRVFQLLAQTAHVRFHERKGVHTRLSEKNRTQRHTRRNTGVSDGGWYLYPRSVSHVSETLRGQVSEQQTLPLLGLGWGGAPEERREPRNSDALMRVAVPRRRGPAGLRDPVVRPLMLRFSVSVRKVSAQSPVNATRSSSHLNPSTTQPSSKNRTQRPTR